MRHSEGDLEIRRLLDVSAQSESNEVVCLAQERIWQRWRAESYRLLSRAHPLTVRERFDDAPASLRSAALASLPPCLSKSVATEAKGGRAPESTQVCPPLRLVIARAIAFGTPPLATEAEWVPEADSVGRIALRLDAVTLGRALFELGRRETLVAVWSVDPQSASRFLDATGLARDVRIGEKGPSSDRRTAYLLACLSQLLMTGLRGESAVQAVGRQHLADLVLHANRSIRCAVTSVLRTGTGRLDATLDATSFRSALTLLGTYEARDCQV